MRGGARRRSFLTCRPNGRRGLRSRASRRPTWICSTRPAGPRRSLRSRVAGRCWCSSSGPPVTRQRSGCCSTTAISRCCCGGRACRCARLRRPSRRRSGSCAASAGSDSPCWRIRTGPRCRAGGCSIGTRSSCSTAPFRCGSVLSAVGHPPPRCSPSSVAEAPVKGSSVLAYEPTGEAAEMYRDLAKEVLGGEKARKHA